MTRLFVDTILVLMVASIATPAGAEKVCQSDADCTGDACSHCPGSATLSSSTTPFPDIAAAAVCAGIATLSQNSPLALACGIPMVFGDKESEAGVCACMKAGDKDGGARIQELEATNQELEATNQELEATTQELEARIQELEAVLAEHTQEEEEEEEKEELCPGISEELCQIVQSALGSVETKADPETCGYLTDIILRQVSEGELPIPWETLAGYFGVSVETIDDNTYAAHLAEMMETPCRADAALAHITGTAQVEVYAQHFAAMTSDSMRQDFCDATTPVYDVCSSP